MIRPKHAANRPGAPAGRWHHPPERIESQYW